MYRLYIHVAPIVHLRGSLCYYLKTCNIARNKMRHCRFPENKRIKRAYLSPSRSRV